MKMTDYTHILVAVDFSTSVDQVLSKACDIAQRNNAKISLLHVTEYLPPIDITYEPALVDNWVINEHEMLAQAMQSLQKLSKNYGLENAALKVQAGIPKREISHYIQENQCDLVVLGSHGRHGINLLLGSTANAVLHDMPCDILTIKLAE
jgi:universal stress protein A